MGGLDGAIASIFEEKILHGQECKNVEQCKLICKKIEEFSEVSNDYDETDDNEKRRILIKKMTEFPFWTTNMVENLKIDECPGCEMVGYQFMITCSINQDDFIEDDSDKDLIEIVKPLTDLIGEDSFFCNYFYKFIDEISEISENK